MIRYALFVLSRASVAAFFLCTWAYAVATYSPFAFDMFVRPQLFPIINSFAVWHHIWYWAVYLLTVATLVPELTRPYGRRGDDAVRWAALGYVAVFGATGAYLAGNPVLPRLWSETRSLFVVLVSLLPLLWLAVIDCLAAKRILVTLVSSHNTGQRRLLAACAGTATYLSLVYVTRAIWDTPWAGIMPTLVPAAWAVALNVVTFTIVYVVLNLAAAAGATRRTAGAWELTLAAAIAAGAIGEFFRRVVLTAVAFDPLDAVPVSIVAGIAFAATWMGVVLRRPSLRGSDAVSGYDAFFAPRLSDASRAAGALVVLPVLFATLLTSVQRFDWNLVFQRTLVIVECGLVFGMTFHVCRRMRGGRWSAPRLAIPALCAAAMLYGLPAASAWLVDSTRDDRLDPQLLLDRYASTDPLFKMISAAFVGQPDVDADYYRFLLDHSTTPANPSGATMPVEFAASEPAPNRRRPHIFLFVIDSLRRDYVSSYNPAVTFTPNIDAFGRENFVFRNAFTLYGGTWLAMPSIWTGGDVARGLNRAGFQWVNALEKLVAAEDYRVVINDHTVAQHLKASTPVVFLDPEVPSVETDLCPLLGTLQRNLDGAVTDRRPVLAFLAPMNVHILNTRSPASQSGDGAGAYAGFFEPYAARLERLDACFGTFISYLKERGLYDNSIIALTSDHGDSLGEEGRWGHQSLFPEDLRVPLIVRIPSDGRSGVTTDLSRIAFLTDITPTLYSLLGHRVLETDTGFGAPLFVPADSAPTPRRRGSFLVMSSYGPNYGLLRRNGQYLYVSDLVEWRELAFDLSREPNGRRVAVTSDARRTNQRLIRQRVGEIARLFNRTVSIATSE